MTPATCYPVDTTPGDTFGGLGTDGLTEYREEEMPRLLHELRPVKHRYRFPIFHHNHGEAPVCS
jgi:hypothetical protein